MSRASSARRNAAPTKKDVIAQAHANEVVWKPFHPYDWAAVAVALDAFAAGDLRQANAILGDLRATNGSVQSEGLVLKKGYLAPDDPDLDRAGLSADAPQWVLGEGYMGTFVPYAVAPKHVGMPARVVGGHRRAALGSTGDWWINNFRGESSILTFPTEAFALSFAKDVVRIDRDGRVTLRPGPGVMTERELRSLERSALAKQLASYRRIGADRAAIGDLVTQIEAYDELLTELEPDATPNRGKGKGGRVKVYEAAHVAREMRETFANRAVERIERLAFGWPVMMQAIGESLAVAYGSDKWKSKDSRGRREVELYKHLAESNNRVLARPGVIRDKDAPSRPWPVIGPKVRLADVPMPEDFAVLGLFEGIDLKLFTAGTASSPRYGRGDDGIIHVRVSHGYLGGSKILWSELDPGRADEPFIFVYTKDGGVMFLVIGEELGIEKDGIVG